MATCKECFHYKICKIVYRNGDDRVLKNSPCEYFKNKADYEKIKHGKWLNNIEKVSTPAGTTKGFAVGYKCSLCGRTEINIEPYCNCGAKMEGNYNEQT